MAFRDRARSTLSAALRAAEPVAGDRARAAAEKALIKAETAYDKRFEGQNEFRAQMADQQRTYVTKSEVYLGAGFLISVVVAVFAILGFFQPS